VLLPERLAAFSSPLRRRAVVEKSRREAIEDIFVGLFGGFGGVFGVDWRFNGLEFG